MSRDALERLRSLNPFPEELAAPPIDRLRELLEASYGADEAVATPARGARRVLGRVTRLLPPVLAVCVAIVIAVVAVSGLRHTVTKPRSLGPTPHRRAIQFAGLHGPGPNLMTAVPGQFFGGVLNERSRTFTIERIDSGGSISRRAVRDPLAWYFSQIAAEGRDVFLATNVVKRFTNASDELLRLSASTLRQTGRITLPSGVVALVAVHGDVWVALADRILRIDSGTLRIAASFRMPGAGLPPTSTNTITSLALGPGGLWATYASPGHSWLYQVNPGTLAVISRRAIPMRGGGARVVAGLDSTWLSGENFVRRVSSDGRLGPAVSTTGLQAAAVAGQRLLALLDAGGSPNETLVQIDDRGAIVGRTHVGDAGGEIASNGRSVWLLHGLKLAHWVLSQG